jgi:2-iminoacetate synthase ThiH
MQLTARDIRLARTFAEVEKSTADLQRLKAAGMKAVDDALATAERPEVREHLQNTRSLLDRYTAGVEELAKAQNTLLVQTNKRIGPTPG